MEYCALGDLSYFIKKRDTVGNNPMTRDMIQKYPNPRVGGLNEVVVRHFLQQLSSSLSFLRSQNLIHRDVKPQNLLLNPSPLYYEQEKPDMMPFAVDDGSLIPICGVKSLPMLKLADFGFARSLPSTSLAETLCGSPLYMAPEILRYEKYDAKADLWSVGTVLYEMVTGKPPFRASNHVELLRRIEKGEDRIKFPEEVLVSAALKNLVRTLLKRDPKDRCSFPAFFSNEVIIDPIPGLMDEDKPPDPVPPTPPRDIVPRRASQTEPLMSARRHSRAFERGLFSETQTTSDEPIPRPSRDSLERPSHALQSRRHSARPADELEVDKPKTDKDGSIAVKQLPRPPCPSYATAPAKPGIQSPSTKTANERLDARFDASADNPRDSRRPEESSRLGAQINDKERERVAQDIAFERDYVVVEKKAVEVNAFADELAANPRIQSGVPRHLSPKSGAMVRRATTSAASPAAVGAPQGQSKAVQIAPGRGIAEASHRRQSSYERRYGPSPSSASSAISKALNLASGRLFGVGFSPPLMLGRGKSPPTSYNPFPAYPVTPGSLVLAGDGHKMTLDEDAKLLQTTEEFATRSDVVYGFAEVKYQQLIPSAPSAKTGLGLQNTLTVAETTEESGNMESIVLDVEARVIVSEEALVLYIKALSLLAKSMDIAGRWWARKNRGDVLADPQGQRASAAPATNLNTGIRVNNVVQWIRSRFNEVLEKAEVVRLTLMDSRKKLPADHPSHPDNHTAFDMRGASLGTSADQVVVSSGVTAEKMMYDRAVDMSRTSAINELTGEDLPSCEINYITAIRLLEAVLEDDDEPQLRKSSNISDKGQKNSDDENAPIDGLEDEDRKAVKSCMFRPRFPVLVMFLWIFLRTDLIISGPKHPSSPPRSPEEIALHAETCFNDRQRSPLQVYSSFFSRQPASPFYTA